MQPSHKLNSIQILRAIAVIMVLIFHTISTERKYSNFEWLSFFEPIGLYGVDLFFVLSGFIITHISLKKLQDKYNKYQLIKEFLIHRILRIYPVYWIFSIIILAIYIARPEMVNSSSTTQPDILGSFLLTAPKDSLLLAVGWTLSFELYFYLVFGLVYALGKKSLPFLWFAWAFLVSFFNLLFPESIINHHLLHIAASPLVFEFICGSIVGYWAHSNPKNYKIALPSLAISIVYMIIIQKYNAELPEDWSRSLLMAIPCALLVLANINLESHFKWPKPLILIGNASYSIYLSHVLVLSATGRILEKILPAFSPWAHFIWIITSIGLAIIFGILNYLFIEKPLLSLYSKRKLTKISL